MDTAEPIRVVIYGAGGHARQVHQVIKDVNCERRTQPLVVLGFLDDDPSRWGTHLHGLPVLGDAGWLVENPDVVVAHGVGSSVGRKRVVEELRALGRARFATLVHPRAWVADDAVIGDGTVVCAGAAVDTDTTIGQNALLNKNCTVGHDAVLGDFVTVSPGFNVSGKVRIGEGAELGAGGSAIPGVTIGAYTTIGACAAVIRDVPAHSTAVGVPAKVIKTAAPSLGNRGVSIDANRGAPG